MKKIFILLVSVCLSQAALAQSNFTISYVMGVGTGDLGDFVDKTSWRGFSMDYRYMVQPNMAVGLTSGWQTFYEELGSSTYTSDGASLTGKQFRYSNHAPIIATFTYFSKPEESTNPFVGLGIGTVYTRRNTDMNVYTLEQEAWNFALVPEIGVQLTISEGVAVAISGKYYYGFEAGELTGDQSYFALNVGFAFF
jgi:hypothetical protein